MTREATLPGSEQLSSSFMIFVVDFEAVPLREDFLLKSLILILTLDMKITLDIFWVRGTKMAQQKEEFSKTRHTEGMFKVKEKKKFCKISSPTSV